MHIYICVYIHTYSVKKPAFDQIQFLYLWVTRLPRKRSITVSLALTVYASAISGSI